jgi:hypothetical protein
MDQIKLVAADLSQDDTQQPEAATSAKANDVRTLSDLEMVLCGGGEGAVCW